ncbi:type IX secretion system plug protein, partial [Ferruginibacter sp.]
MAYFWYLTNVFYLNVKITHNMIKVQSCNAVQGRFFFPFTKRKEEQNKFTTMMTELIKPGQKLFLFFVFIFIFSNAFAQTPDAIYKPNIQCVRFHPYGDQTALAIYNLNSGDQLELNFDDLDANVKSYYYTFQLCDYNWKPVDISPFMYIKGFTQQRIATNRYSSIAFTKYTHYQAIVPDRNTTITLSGNYLLKPMGEESLYTLYLSGANALVNRKKLIELGGFDEIFSPFYIEDC